MANRSEKQEALNQNSPLSIKQVWVLGAGHGSRLKTTGHFKPWIPILGRPLILHTLDRILPLLKPITLILHPAQESVDRSPYEEFKNSLIHLHFKETPSSMHTLWEAWNLSRGAENQKGHILVSLVDPILDPNDWNRFLERAQSLQPDESLVLTSRFVDDEKPLYAWTEKDCKVTRFTGEPPPSLAETQVTAGVYCLSVAVLPLLDQCFKSGQMHLRNFLQNLINAKLPVYAFPVDKTIDIDRPEDVETANTFLQKGRSVWA